MLASLCNAAQVTKAGRTSTDWIHSRRSDSFLASQIRSLATRKLIQNICNKEHEKKRELSLLDCALPTGEKKRHFRVRLKPKVAGRGGGKKRTKKRRGIQMPRTRKESSVRRTATKQHFPKGIWKEWQVPPFCCSTLAPLLSHQRHGSLANLQCCLLHTNRALPQ